MQARLGEARQGEAWQGNAGKATMDKTKLIENMEVKIRFLERDLRKLKNLEEEEQNGKRNKTE